MIFGILGGLWPLVTNIRETKSQGARKKKCVQTKLTVQLLYRRRRRRAAVSRPLNYVPNLKARARARRVLPAVITTLSSPSTRAPVGDKQLGSSWFVLARLENRGAASLRRRKVRERKPKHSDNVVFFLTIRHARSKIRHMGVYLPAADSSPAVDPNCLYIPVYIHTLYTLYTCTYT